MARFFFLIIFGAAAVIEAQSPSPVTSSSPASPSPSSSPAARPSPSAPPTPNKVSNIPSPSPSPTPTTQELINSLNPVDLQTAITLLKNNFIDPDLINETQLNRAMLEGLIVRLGHGLVLLP